jgi:CheY-like chemotaxis protein/HPt (histidine-containing phosphotransfer) domain-containing protein
MDERPSLSQQALAAGIQAYVHKPVTASALLNAIQKALLPVSTQARPEPRRYESAVQSAPRHLRGKRILLVEDNRMNQEVALHFLRRAGLEVEVAAHGGEALERLSQSTYDAVLMDCQMPVMDGFEATAELRRRERENPGSLRQTVIALTAYAMRGDRERCLEAGMDDYLRKPIRLDELHAMLARWIAPTTAPASGSPAPPGPREEEIGASAIPAVDSAALDQLRVLQRPGAPDIIRRTVATYLESSRTCLGQLREALAGGDAEVFHRSAHTLKSSSAIVGATLLAELSRELETLSRGGIPPGASEKVAELEGEHRRVVESLQSRYGEAA